MALAHSIYQHIPQTELSYYFFKYFLCEFFLFRNLKICCWISRNDVFGLFLDLLSMLGYYIVETTFELSPRSSCTFQPKQILSNPFNCLRFHLQMQTNSSNLPSDSRLQQISAAKPHFPFQAACKRASFAS